MATVNISVEQQVLIEAINQLERLETLAAQSDNSESERKALRQAIAELKQLIHAHAC